MSGRRYKKKAYRKKGKKSYARRFNDRAINTKIESKILAIAQREDRRNQVWFTPRRLIAADVFTPALWKAHGAYLRIPTASMLRINAGSLWHARLTDWGDQVKSRLTGNSESKKIVLRCSGFTNYFNFRCSGSSPNVIRIWIVSVSGANVLDDGKTVPAKEMMPGGHLNGLFFGHTSEPRQSLDYKYKILADKTVTIPSSYTYMGAMNSTGTYATGSGALSFNNTEPVFVEKEVKCTLNKYYKGLGKTFIYDGASDLRAKQEEVFVCFISDSVVDFCANIGAKYRIDSPMTQSQPTLPAHAH